MDDTYETSIEEALLRLEDARRLLTQEITDYPGPVSGCDAQFNRLLGDRTRIAKAIQALHQTPFIPTPRRLEQGAQIESR